MSMEIQLNEIRSHGIEREDDETFIYSLMHEDLCIYVGQTKNLKQRLFNHLANEKDFTSAIVYLCYDEDANNEEAKTIVKRHAYLNNTLPKNDLFVPLNAVTSVLTKKITEELFLLNAAYSSRVGKRLKYFEVNRSEEIIKRVCGFIEEMESSIDKAIEADK